LDKYLSPPIPGENLYGITKSVWADVNAQRNNMRGGGGGGGSRNYQRQQTASAFIYKS
jgi:hypothetical protein